MVKSRFAIIGGGWRAEFFLRVARALPERFELTGVLLRSDRRKSFWDGQGVPVYFDADALFDTHPDFVILSVSKPAIADNLVPIATRGLPILCETPPADTLADLARVRNAFRAHPADVQVAEQYPYWPYYIAWKRAIDLGLIGAPSNMSISAIHGYHAIAIIREFLGEGFSDAAFVGARYSFPALETLTRQGVVSGGEVKPMARDRLDIVFADGKAAFFDFSGVQYRSFVRDRRFNVQGERGEIDGLTCRYVTRDGAPISAALQRVDFGMYGNQGWSLHTLALNETTLYTNPFPGARLNDDEIAVATCMERMARHCTDPSVEVYSLENALHDAYFAILMEQALDNPHTVVNSDVKRALYDAPDSE